MGFYMRFIVYAEPLPALEAVAVALAERDAGYRLEEQGSRGAELFHGEDLLAELELNVPGDGLFDEEREELLEALGDAAGDAAQAVRATLQLARGILAVKVVLGGRPVEDTLRRLNALWAYLFDHHEGLLQADDEGYYDESGALVLERPGR